MLHLNIPLILVIMVKTGRTFGDIQDFLKVIDLARQALETDRVSLRQLQFKKEDENA